VGRGRYRSGDPMSSEGCEDVEDEIVGVNKKRWQTSDESTGASVVPVRRR